LRVAAWQGRGSSCDVLWVLSFWAVCSIIGAEPKEWVQSIVSNDVERAQSDGSISSTEGVVTLVVTVGSLGVIGWVIKLLGYLHGCFDRMQLIKHGKAWLWRLWDIL